MLNVIFKHFKSASPCNETLGKHEAGGCLPRAKPARQCLSSSPARTPAQEDGPGLWDFGPAK